MRKIKALIILVPALALPLSAQTYSLQDCITMAKSSNAVMESARLEVRKAEEVRSQAFAKYFPSIQAGAAGGHFLNPIVSFSTSDIGNTAARDRLNLLYNEYGAALGLDDEISLFQYGVGASVSAVQPICAGGQIVNANALAKTAVQAANKQAEVTERELELKVEENFYLVISLEEKRRALESAMNTLDTLKKNVLIAKEAGVAMPNDMIRVELKQNELFSQQVQLENALVLSRKSLCQIVGIEWSEDIVFETELDYADTMDGECARLAELDLLDLNIKAAGLRKKMEVGKALPQIGIGITASYNDFFRRDSFNAGLFVTVRIPISDWWSASHRIKECKYSVRQAELQRRDAEELMELRHSQTKGKIEECVQVMRQNETAVSLARENFRIATLGYEAGTVSISDLLESQALMYQAESDYTDSKIKCLIYRSRYSRGL
ncbi:MAG: TolC family protein [Candidatus Cryptobacteroides sp.]